MGSIQPRKQRRALHRAPLHRRVRQVRAHLSEELLVKYGRRSARVRVGDTVKVIRGTFKGTVGKVLTVDHADFRITIEGVTVAKADGKQKPKPVHASDVILTRLDLTDRRRRAKLGSAAEAEGEEQERAAKAAVAERPAGPAPAALAGAEAAAPGLGEPEEEPEEPEEPEEEPEGPGEQRGKPGKPGEGP